MTNVTLCIARYVRESSTSGSVMSYDVNTPSFCSSDVGLIFRTQSWDILRSTLRSWLLTSGPTLLCLCKPFPYKACSGTILPYSLHHHFSVALQPRSKPKITHSAKYTGEQPKTKSARDPTNKPQINRGFSSSIGLRRILFVRTSEETSRRVVFDDLEGNE